MSGYPVGSSPAAPGAFKWTMDAPESHHNEAGGISFADGHAELHRWKNPGSFDHASPLSIIPAPNSPDVAWMQNVTARPH